MPQKHNMAWKNDLKHLIKHESVLHIDDLVYRRTCIGDNPARVRILAEEIASLFEWDEPRKQRELSTLMSMET
jgi:glycerol-3-phosphate dehydrogenase